MKQLADTSGTSAGNGDGDGNGERGQRDAGLAVFVAAASVDGLVLLFAPFSHLALAKLSLRRAAAGAPSAASAAAATSTFEPQIAQRFAVSLAPAARYECHPSQA